MIVIIIILQHLRMIKPEMPFVQELNRVDELVMTQPKRASHIFLLNVPTALTHHGTRLAQSVEHETLNLSQGREFEPQVAGRCIFFFG